MALIGRRHSFTMPERLESLSGANPLPGRTLPGLQVCETGCRRRADEVGQRQASAAWSWPAVEAGTGVVQARCLEAVPSASDMTCPRAEGLALLRARNGNFSWLASTSRQRQTGGDLINLAGSGPGKRRRTLCPLFSPAAASPGPVGVSARRRRPCRRGWRARVAGGLGKKMARSLLVILLGTKA